MYAGEFIGFQVSKRWAPVMTLTELASILRAKLAKLSHFVVSSRCDTPRLIVYKQKSDAGEAPLCGDLLVGIYKK